jgi:hypothetical protein
MSALVAQNKANIGLNRRAIFELEGDVHHNKARCYHLRSQVAENASLIKKNYDAAFLGNRQLANENTEALFRNRLALAQSLPSSTDVEVNAREATINCVKLQYLEARSKLNGDVLAITQEMSNVNAQNIAINRRIMELNESIKNSNADLIAENTKWIESGGCCGAPTPESNAEKVANNAAKIASIKARVATNNGLFERLQASVDENRANILENAKQIAERRIAIAHNHDLIAANRSRIGEKVQNR